MDRFDSAILCDVLQRSREPKVLLARAASAVRSGGHMLIHVPADSSLMGATDAVAGHVLRFGRGDVEELVSSAGLELVDLRPFNRIGRWGWQLHHACGVGRITRSQAKLFDLFGPIARRIDRIGAGKGLSWICVARVP